MKPIDSAKPGGEHRILICEDNHLIAMGWASLLAATGYDVVGPAHTGEKRVFRRNVEFYRIWSDPAFALEIV